MFCTNCGNKLAEGSSFCSNCGARLIQPAAADAMPAAEFTPVTDLMTTPEPAPTAAVPASQSCINALSILAFASAGVSVISVIIIALI